MASYSADVAPRCVWADAKRLVFSGQHGQHVTLTQDEQPLAVDRELAAAVLPEQDPVADLHFHRHALAVIEPARAGGEDLAFLRFFLGRVRDEQSATALRCAFERAHHDTVCQWGNRDSYRVLRRHGCASLRETASAESGAGRH